MKPETVTEVLKEWQRVRGDEFGPYFHLGYTYLSRTVGELASDDATWTITSYEGRGDVLLLASDKAFAILGFSVDDSEHVRISGALHPIDEGVVRLAFSDEPAAEEVGLVGVDRVRPVIRRWEFDWHGRLQLSIEHWLPLENPPTSAPGVSIEVGHHERQRQAAHRLARGAGWPL